MSIKFCWRILVPTFSLETRAATQSNNATIDDGATAIILTLFKHQDLSAQINRGNGGAHPSNTRTRNQNFGRDVPMLRGGRVCFWRFG